MKIKKDIDSTKFSTRSIGARKSPNVSVISSAAAEKGLAP